MLAYTNGKPNFHYFEYLKNRVVQRFPSFDRPRKIPGCVVDVVGPEGILQLGQVVAEVNASVGHLFLVPSFLSF